MYSWSDDVTKMFENEDLRYGYSYNDFNTTLNKFNLSRLPDYDNAAEPYIAYILMSQPSLYITDDTQTTSLNSSTISGANLSTNRNSSIFTYNSFITAAEQVAGEFAYRALAKANYKALQTNSMSAAYTNDSYGKQMLMSLSEFSANKWLPIITTKAMSYSTVDYELKTVEKGATFYGHVLKYGKHSEEHKISNNITIEFRNDRYLSIMKMMYLWMVYIHLVSKTSYVQPSMYSQMNGILDYCGSIYYLVCRRDGRRLVYWEKLTGVFPTRLPFSMFSSSDQPILEDRLSIDFSYGLRSDPSDPNILIDINMLSGQGPSSMEATMKLGREDRASDFISNGKEIPFVKGDVFASYPYIKMRRLSTGNIEYYLTWIK